VRTAPRIYVSAQRPLGRNFDVLLAGLRNAGIDPYWPDGFRGYEMIAYEIAECDALLAVITWGSYPSTWQGIEVSLASGYPGFGSARLLAPRPVFIYATTEKLPGYVRSLDSSPRPPLHLETNAKGAVEQIVQHLGP
jgi:hypothetical protein